MQVPVRIDFEGSEPSEAVRSAILAHVSDLEDKFGRIVACRVAVKVPGEHHRKGSPFEVNIWLTLPNGRDVAVTSTPSLDERHAEIAFALNDAFRRARRRLQDNVRRMANRTKTHEDAPKGTVTQLQAGDGFGFLTTPDGREIYFHRNSVLGGAFSRLRIGSSVFFAEEEGTKGTQASTVRLKGRGG
jgi:cold shock CspA family protein